LVERVAYKNIVCATRGGEASRTTEDKAIAIAQQSGARLTFLYVVDTSFAVEQATSEVELAMMAADLRHIGKLILERARQRAAAATVEAATELREGAVSEEIEGYVTEHPEVDLLVVGNLSDELRSHLGPFLARLADGGQHVLEVKHHPD
jgi:nucleotide-binding universal stress UspA family protein